MTSTDEGSGSEQGGMLVAILILAIGGGLLNSGRGFWGCFLLAVGAYGLSQSLLEPRVGKGKAANVGMAAATIIVVAGLLSLLLRLEVGWMQATVGSAAAALTVAATHGVFSLIKAHRARVALKSLAVLLLALVLAAMYHFYARQVFMLNALILFLSASFLRQAATELLLIEPLRYSDLSAFILPDALVVSAVVCGFIYYQDSLFFHLLAVVLVIGVLKLATERYIPEVSERERAKIDQASRERKRGLSMFRAVTGTHARVNLLMLPIFLLYENLAVERYLSLLDLQGNVFEASISLLGIVIGFSTLILGDHLIKGSQGRQKQTYLLRGLVGIALLFLVIAGVAFLALVLQPMAAQLQSDVAQPQLVPQLPGIDQIISSFLFDETVRIRVLIALANEFLLFSIPAALFYLFSVIRDLVERYKEVREQEPDLLGASDIDPQDSRGTTDQL